MSLFENPFSLEIPVQIGNLNTLFFINENLYVTNAECISTPHNHHDYEMRYIATGSCGQLIDHTLYTASAGDLLLVPPLEYHCQMQDQIDPTTSQYNLRFTVEAPTPRATAAQHHAYADMIHLLDHTRRVHDNGWLLTLFQQLENEFRGKKRGFVYCVQSLCTCILTEFIRLSGQKAGNILPSEELGYHGYSRSKIDEFFRHKYLTNTKIQDLADDMKISPRQVNRIMNRMFGLSFTQKLTEMRLRRAIQLLTYTDQPIAQISRECGFNNYDYFFTCFRKSFHMSPGKYRLRSREELHSQESVKR